MKNPLKVHLLINENHEEGAKYSSVESTEGWLSKHNEIAWHINKKSIKSKLIH